MKPIESLCILGTGKLAESLLIALTEHNNAFDIFIAGRNAQKTAELCKRFQVKPLEPSLLFKMPVLLCVPDDVIAAAAKTVEPIASCIIHFSGATSIEVLQPLEGGRGVLWPLQSFGTPKSPEDWKHIPLVTQVEGKLVRECIDKLTAVLGGSIYELNDAARKKMHLSAVFMNNFMHHVARVTFDYCNKNNVPFEALKPLVNETFKSVFAHPPKETQTGPARRGDIQILTQHELMLAQEPEMLEIYRLISHQIITHYH